MRWHALIPAAGGGTRFGGERPKQYLSLAGKPVLRHAIERLLADLPLERVYVLIAADDAWYDTTIGTIDRVTALRCGGGTRAESVRNGLAALAGIAEDDDWIVVHDAVRPCIDSASLARLAASVRDDPVGGLLAVPVVSSLKRADDAQRVVRSESRDRLWDAQTPQMFRYALLARALQREMAVTVTDESQAIEALGEHPLLVPGSSRNVKITHADDLCLAEALLAAEPRMAGAGTAGAQR